MRLWAWAVTAIALTSGCASRKGSIQNNTGQPELTALAEDALAQQLKARGLTLATYELNTRIDALAEGGLQIQILCSTQKDHLIKASIEVRGHGGPSERLISQMMSRAAAELAVECR